MAQLDPPCNGEVLFADHEYCLLNDEVAMPTRSGSTLLAASCLSATLTAQYHTDQHLVLPGHQLTIELFKRLQVALADAFVLHILVPRFERHDACESSIRGSLLG